MQNWNIAVTEFSKTPLLDTIRTPDDLGASMLSELEEFFSNYNRQFGKQFRVLRSSASEGAEKAARHAMRRFASHGAGRLPAT